jgi:chromosome segregation ATPase
MSQSVDIQKVFTKSVSQVSVDALSKKGFKQVKVLNQATVLRLIGEAVDSVLTSRSKKISEQEREKVISESRAQFESLAKQRLEKERSRIEALAMQNRALEGELETQKKRAATIMEVQAERDQAKARVGALEENLGRAKRAASELEEALAAKSTEAAQLKAQLGSKAEEAARLERQATADAEEHRRKLRELQDQLHEKSATAVRAGEETVKLREEFFSGQRRLAELAGLLAAKEQEIGQLRNAAPVEAIPSEAMMDRLFLAISDQMKSVAESSSGVGDLKRSLEGLSQKISRMGKGGGEEWSKMDDSTLEAYFEKTAGTDTDVESNVSKVKVRQAKAGAVKGALAKLKELQQAGGEDGE